MSDPVAEMLRRSPIMPSQRADLWDAYEAAGDEDALAAALGPMKVPNVVKARLWDLKYSKATETPDPVDPDKGTLNEEPRTPAIGEDPRIAPDSVYNEAQTRKIASDTAEGLAMMGSMAAGGPVARVLASPYTWGAVAGGKELLHSGDVSRAGAAASFGYIANQGAAKVLGLVGKQISKALAARLEHQVTRAAMAEAPAVAKAATEAVAPVAKATEAEIEALLVRATDATAPSQVRLAARSALQKAGWTPDAGMMATPIVEEAAPVAASVAETAAPAVRKFAPIPEKGNVKMATVYMRPAGAPPTRSEAARTLQSSGSRSLAEKQAELAKSAGMDVGEAFGTAAPKAPAAQAEQAAESALETRLRASVMMKKDPMALANEIAGRVQEMSKAKPEQIVNTIEEMYGLPRANVKQMVEMVLREHGK